MLSRRTTAIHQQTRQLPAAHPLPKLGPGDASAKEELVALIFDAAVVGGTLHVGRDATRVHVVEAVPSDPVGSQAAVHAAMAEGIDGDQLPGRVPALRRRTGAGVVSICKHLHSHIAYGYMCVCV
jgi:hypothetical protein